MNTNCLRNVIAIIVAVTLWSGLAETYGIDIGPMTWTQRSDWVNVQNPSAYYGMAGFTAATGNGTTDDTAALQAILTYIQTHYNNPHTIYFPPGTYKITSTLTISGVSGLSFLGSGSNTIISWAGPTGGAMYAPNGTSGMRYIGLVWEGNNTAACAYEEDSPDVYAGGLRHENESFRDINAPASYSYLIDTTGDRSTTPVPPTGAIVSGYPNSLTGETQVWNCRFSNCTSGISESWDTGNFICWFVDSCEFDNCGIGINFNGGGANVVTSSHFQNSTTADILGGADTHIRHCTSIGSSFFFTDSGILGNPLDPSVIEDCWIDSWTNPSCAMYFQRAGPTTVFDCTFTTPPSGASSPIACNTANIVENHLLLSNNYAFGLPTGTQLVNCLGEPTLLDVIPPGLRFGALTLKSASQTFLNTTYPADSTHIIDISQAPYVSQWTYPNQNGLYPIIPDITTALQNAITAARTANNGSVVYIPSGIYNLSSTMTASGSNYTIEGNGYSTELCWWGANNTSMISISSPQNITVKNIRMTVQNGQSVAAITATSTAATALTFDDISYGTFQVTNPASGAGELDGPGLVLSNLPAGSTVYAPLLNIMLSVQNCGAAQILTKYDAGGGTTTVSGTIAQTGFLGTLFTEGGNGISGNYDISVTDNQDLIFGDYYVEQDNNNISMSRGSGTVTNGRVTIGGFNTGSGNGNGGSGSQYLVNVNNYEGRLFYGSAELANWYGNYPVSIYQTGTNPIDMIFAGMSPVSTFTYSLGSSANLIATLNVDQNPYPGADIPESPSTVTAADLLSMAQGLDHFRQLEAVDLSVQDGLSTDGPPVAQYPFEGNALDMTAKYNGTAHTITYVTGLGAQAASFNGTSSYVQIDNPVTTSFSIAMWIYTTDTGGTGQWYKGHGLVDGYTAASANDFGTSLTGGKFSFGVGKTDTTLTSTLAVNDGAWHHLVATRNSTSGAMQVYVDGVLNNSVTGPTGTKSAATTLRMGSLKTGTSGSFFNGVIDQVQIFNYVASATDVANLYNRTKSLLPQPSGLVAYWKLDETSGTTSYDSSGNSINGAWVNGPAFTTDHPSAITFSDPGSLLFNGGGQFVTMGAPMQLPSGKAPRSICGWAKSNGMSSYGMFVSYGTAALEEGFFIGAYGTNLIAGVWGDDMPGVANFWDGNWHFICMTYDGTTANLYADGTLVNSVAKPAWNLVPSVCYVGCAMNQGSFWNGPIDDVRIYNRALSATEVSQLAAGNLVP